MKLVSAPAYRDRIEVRAVYRNQGDAHFWPEFEKNESFSKLFLEKFLNFLNWGYPNQDEPILVRMMDKDSHWGVDNGLQTMIPTAFLFSTLGYPFILPGNNSYA